MWNRNIFKYLQTSAHKLNNKKVFLGFSLFLLFLLCFIPAFADGITCNFFPTNGTFQNFNPVRRFLSGQIPYRDFSDYLGLGHLYTGTVFTFLFGGNYQASLMAFSFLQYLSFALISIFIGKAIVKNTQTAISTTNVLLFLLCFLPLFLSSKVKHPFNAVLSLTTCLKSGNSARFVRGMILAIIMMSFYAGERKLSALIEKYPALKKHYLFIYASSFGILAGGALLWSNDYGISSFVCAFCISLWITFCKTRNVKETALILSVYLISSVIGTFLFGEILTLGHFDVWLKTTFGVGNFQRWYYNYGGSAYIFELDLTFLNVMHLVPCIIYGAKLFVDHANRNSVFRFGIPAFCNLTVFCAANEYKLLSGGLLHEVSEFVLYLTILFEVIAFFNNHLKNKKNYFILICRVIFRTFCTVWLFSVTVFEIFFFFTKKQPDSIAELGRGYCLRYEDLISAKDFLGDKKIFSTYASAQEIMQKQFQPSGWDYIIHVLGDEQREKYLEAFRKENFDYVLTINEEYDDWENWIKRANWFFYRELYKNYHPVFENTYARYWQKNANGVENVISANDVNVSIKIEDLDVYRKRIIISADSHVNGIADVFIDYEVSKNKESKNSKYILNMNLLVEDISYSVRGINSLRSKNAEYIPVNIENGHGELILTSKPAESTCLKINKLHCDSIFFIPNKASPTK